MGGANPSPIADQDRRPPFEYNLGMPASSHPFRETDPKNLDCGDLTDSETGECLRPATAREAANSIKAQRHEGGWRGIISTSHIDPVLARVRGPEGVSLEDWRLAVALKLRWERSMSGL